MSKTAQEIVQEARDESAAKRKAIATVAEGLDELVKQGSGLTVTFNERSARGFKAITNIPGAEYVVGNEDGLDFAYAKTVRKGFLKRKKTEYHSHRAFAIRYSADEAGAQEVLKRVTERALKNNLLKP